MKSNFLNEKTLKKIIADEKVRRTLMYDSFLYFSTVYFPQYFNVGFAPFQHEMINIIENKSNELSVIIAFRGCGKSTMFTTISPLWHIMGRDKNKLIVIVSQTEQQTNRHMRNIKSELEENDLLKKDLGPFKEKDNKWSSSTLEFLKYGAQIVGISIDQSNRGLRYKQHRPDVIICDDLEDSSSVMTSASRKKTKNLFSSEIVPMGKQDAKIYLVGNYLHEDSLINTYRQKIIKKQIRGKDLFVPIIDKNGQITWPQKFKCMDDIRKLKEKINNHVIWSLEYMLEPVDSLIYYYTRRNINFFDKSSPAWKPYFKFRVAGVDLAIGEKDSNDYTAIVTADVYKFEDKYHIYILPHVVNKRVGPNKLSQLLKEHSEYGGVKTHLFVEATSFQKLLIEQLKSDNIPVSGVEVGNISKAERLILTIDWHEKNQLHFHHKIDKRFIDQLTGFENERHDDLVDAFTLLVNEIIKLSKDNRSPEGYIDFAPMIISCNDIRPRVNYGDSGQSRSIPFSSYFYQGLRKAGVRF